MARLKPDRPAILVTRPRAQSLALAAVLRRCGHRVLVAPLAEPRTLKPELPDDARALVLTSARAVPALLAHPQAGQLKALPVHAIGAATALAAHKAGFHVLSESDGDRAQLVRQVAAASTGPVLICQGEPAAGDLAAELGRAGVAAVARTLYRMAPVEALPPHVCAAFASGAIGWVILLSAETARRFRRMVMGLHVPIETVALACLSEAVAIAAGSGWRKVVTGSRPDVAILLTEAGLLCDNTRTMRNKGRST